MANIAAQVKYLCGLPVFSQQDVTAHVYTSIQGMYIDYPPLVNADMPIHSEYVLHILLHTWIKARRLPNAQRNSLWNALPLPLCVRNFNYVRDISIE